MSIKTKWLSILLIIISALILVYGFIDKNSYRAGYAAGYTTVSRAINRACIDDRITDDTLCEEAVAALFESEGNNGVYIAEAVSNILPAEITQSVTSTITAKVTTKAKAKAVVAVRKKKRKTPGAGATTAVTVSTPAPVAPTFPEGLSPFIWIAKSSETLQQSSLVSNATAANVTAALDRQKIIAAQCPQVKILFYAGGLPETADINETKGLASCPSAGIPDSLFSDGMSVQDSAGGVYTVKKTSTFEFDGSLGLTLVTPPPPPPPPPPPSPEEVKKAQALAVDCTGAGKNSEQCLAMDPYCVMSVVKRDGSSTYVNADYTAGCTDSEVKISRISFNPGDPCSQADIQARMPRARMVTGTDGTKICSDNITYLYLKEDTSSRKLMPLGDKGSLSELLRSPGLKDFAQKAGAKATSIAPAVVAPSLPLCSTVAGRVPMPACTPDPMPSGGHMSGGCASPMHWDSSRNMCVTAVYRPSLIAQFVETIIGLFRRPQ